MSNARPELPYPCVYKAKWRINTYLRGRLCDHILCHVYNTFQRIICTIWTMQLQTLQYEIGVKVARIVNKSPLVGENDFPSTEIVDWMAHYTIIFMNSSCVE